MMRTRKQIKMTVTVSVPLWLSAAQARKEVRSLIKDQTHWGHRPSYWNTGLFDEIDSDNFRVASIRPAK